MIRKGWRRLTLLLMLATVSCGSPRLPITVAIVNVTVIDEMGPRPHQTVLISHDRIVRVETGPDAAVPEAAEVVDGTGRYLIPGLWDMHTHVTMFGSGSEALALYVANGVTGIRDMGAVRLAEAKALRDGIADGRVVGPRMFIATPIVENAAWLAAARDLYDKAGASTEWAQERFGPRTSEEAVRWLDSIVTFGVDHLKIRSWPEREVATALIVRAREHGLPVAAHANWPFPPEGLASVEHGLWPPHEVSDTARRTLWELLKTHNVTFVTTLTYWPGRLSPVDALIDDLHPERNPAVRYVPRGTREAWRGDLEARRGESPMDWSAAYQAELRNLKEMRAAGVTIMPGSDPGSQHSLPGFGLHEELALLVELGGIPPLEALRAATNAPARFLGVEDSLGSVSPGQLANLVLLNANPRDDIRHTRQIHAVVLQGILLDRERLDRLLLEVERAAR